VKLAKEQGRERLISAAEETLILQQAPPTLRDAFLLVFDAGMRPCEVAALAWERVDLVRGVILVAGDTTKTRSGRRHLPMTKRVREMLIERARLSALWVFPSKRHPGKPMARGAISTMFAGFKRSLGLPRDLVLYSARHTFATDLVGATGNLSQTQRTLGHASISTTTRYLHPSVAELGTIMDIRNAARISESHVLSHGPDTVQ
jgi:integrase